MGSLPLQEYPAWIILSAVEVLWFVYLVQDIPRKYKDWRTVPGFILLLISIIIVKRQVFIYQFIYNFLVQAVIFSLYLYLFHEVSIKNCLYICGVYLLILDGVRMFTQDGIFDLLLTQIPYNTPELINVIIYILICSAIELSMLRMVKKRMFKNNKDNLSVAQMLLILLPVVPYAYIKQLTLAYNFTELSFSEEFTAMKILLSICTITVIIGNEYNLSAQIQKSKMLKMESLLKEQHRQYLVKQETMTAINQKYHDMKHYLTGIEAMGTQSMQVNEFVKALRKEIEPIEASHETGNEILNIILTEKIQFCQKNNIQIIPYIDGKWLEFIDPMDICTIFGNVIDNAIEAVLPLAEESRREISIKVARNNNMLVMRFHNYYTGELRIGDSSLLTSKPDADNHGYGLRNVRHTLDKYDGSIAYETKDNEFSLHVIVPIPEGRMQQFA